MKKAGAIFLSLLLPFSWLSAFPSAAAEPVIRQPIVRYDFSDPIWSMWAMSLREVKAMQ